MPDSVLTKSMLTCRGKVCAVEDAYAWVEVGADSGCERCAAGQGCGMFQLARLTAHSRVRVVQVAQNHPVKDGDSVEIGFDAYQLVAQAVKTYLWPLVGLFVFAIVADQVFKQTDAVVAISALGGLLVTGKFAWWRTLPRASVYLPVILRKF